MLDLVQQLLCLLQGHSEHWQLAEKLQFGQCLAQLDSAVAKVRFEVEQVGFALLAALGSVVEQLGYVVEQLGSALAQLGPVVEQLRFVPAQLETVVEQLRFELAQLGFVPDSVQL